MIAAIMRLSLFSSKQCIIKQLLDSVFVISGIIKVKVSVSVFLISQKPHPIIVYYVWMSNVPEQYHHHHLSLFQCYSPNTPSVIGV